MRLGLICTEKLPVPAVRGGAIQTYIEHVAPRLATHHQVTVLCRRDPLLPDAEERTGVRYVRLPAESPGEYARSLARFLAAEPPFDLIEQFNRPALLLALAPWCRGARLFLSLHNEMLAPDRITTENGRQVLAMTERVVTISDFIRRRVAERFPEFADRLRTVRSGVDTGQILPWHGSDEARLRRRAIRRALGLEGRRVLLHISRFSPKKGNHLVLDGLERVRRLDPRAILLLVGSTWYGRNQLDAYGRSVERRALSLPGDAVRMTGFLPPSQIPDMLLAGDLFLCASQWEEPLARVHYEAMAAGLPILTTDRGGNAEVIEEGCNGLFVRPHDDAGALADLALRLLADPELRFQMGSRGRELAERHYTWERVAGELLHLFAGG